MSTTTTHPEVKNYIDGQFERNGGGSMDVITPAGASLTQCDLCSAPADLELE